MKFIVDHDYHIHTGLSLCSNDKNQTVDRIVRYARENGLKKVCITDHFWDSKVEGASNWYSTQNYEHIAKVLPIKHEEDVQIYFGCETDLDKHHTLGIHRDTFTQFDFVIIPTTHLHMNGFTIDEEDFSIKSRQRLYIERFESVLKMNLPFEKIGIAHLTCSLIAPENPCDHIEVLRGIKDEAFSDLFKLSAQKGVGIELNFPIEKYDSDDRKVILRPYLIAKREGCKFYLGSDAHHENGLDTAKNRFEIIINSLDLREEDKFLPHLK